MNKMQVFAWQAFEKGQDVNLQADPTKVELLSKEFEQKRDNFKTQNRDGVSAGALVPSLHACAAPTVLTPRSVALTLGGA